ATARNTSCTTSAASLSCSPRRRHHPYTRGPYSRARRDQAALSCACTRASKLDEVELGKLLPGITEASFTKTPEAGDFHGIPGRWAFSQRKRGDPVVG